MHATLIDVEAPTSPLIRWGAIVAGAVLGLAVMAVLAALWLALAFSSNSTFVRDNLEWCMAGSGAFSLFIAGLVAGLMTDNRGAGSGWLHGLTAWAALLIAAIVFGIPSVFGLFNAGALRSIEGSGLVGTGPGDALWATFLTLVIGAAVAALGGVLGGTPRRRSDGIEERRPIERDRIAPEDGSYDDGVTRTRPERVDGADRLLVSRTDDGVYVDRDGRRYVAESR